MRINFEQAAKAHLTMPQHELAYVTIWHMQIDLCCMRVDGEEYLHFEGKRYGQNPESTKMWHPSQLIIDVCRMARTKCVKFMRTYIADLIEYDLLIPVPTQQPDFPAHLTLNKDHRRFVTAFHPELDVVALRTGPIGEPEILRIGGVDYTVEAERDGAAGYVDWWCDMDQDRAAAEIIKFIFADKKKTVK